MNVIMNDMNLAESKRAIAQAGSVKRITFVAFVYIPLSFTTSFFGMNVRELESGVTPIWVWVASSVLVLVLTVMVLFLDTDYIRRLRSPWRSKTTKCRQEMTDDVMV
jgi:Mg2+ and Co2+ transporter CorA